MTPDEAMRLTATRVRALDTAWPSQPPRTVRRAPTTVPTVLVESVCRQPRIVDRIALHSHATALQRHGVAAPHWRKIVQRSLIESEGPA